MSLCVSRYLAPEPLFPAMSGPWASASSDLKFLSPSTSGIFNVQTDGQTAIIGDRSFRSPWGPVRRVTVAWRRWDPRRERLGGAVDLAVTCDRRFMVCGLW